MDVTVLIFGPLTEVFGRSSLSIQTVADTDTLISQLERDYPSFADQSYLIALDQKVIHTNTILQDGQTIALLPPFSGG